jgi:hypothetical protein
MNSFASGYLNRILIKEYLKFNKMRNIGFYPHFRFIAIKKVEFTYILTTDLPDILMMIEIC